MSIQNELVKLVGSKNCSVNEPMKKHITFKVGGPASYYVTPDCVESLVETIRYCKKEKIRYQIIGNGSNILFTDKGYDGVVIEIGNKLSEVLVDNCVMIAGAGARLTKIANEACKNGLSGLEFAAGIPGTVGGAVVMNAGAYGGEIKDIIVSAMVYDIENDKIITLGNGELELSYRNSIFQKKNYVLLEACFELERGSENAIADKMKELNKRRKDKQPLSYASAGSTFKRPEGYYAGALIEECGLKGYREGNARVSEKHAGFIVNIGNARAEDVINVINHVKETVRREKHVELETEVKIIE